MSQTRFVRPIRLGKRILLCSKGRRKLEECVLYAWNILLCSLFHYAFRYSQIHNIYCCFILVFPFLTMFLYEIVVLNIQNRGTVSGLTLQNKDCDSNNKYIFPRWFLGDLKKLGIKCQCKLELVNNENYVNYSQNCSVFYRIIEKYRICLDKVFASDA